MEEQRGNRDRAAGFGDQSRGGNNGAHGGADLGFGNGDDVIDKSLDCGRSLRLPTLCVRRPSAMVRLVSSAAHVTMEPARKLSAVSAGKLWLDADYFGLRTQLLHRCGHAAEQAAAGYRGNDEVHAGEVFDNLQAAGGLTGDDLLIVIRGNDDIAVLAHKLLGDGEALAGCKAHVYNFGTEDEGGGALDGRGVRRHDDDGFGTDDTGCIGYALSMIAAGVGDDATADFFWGELQNFVGGAAILKAPMGCRLSALR